MSLDASTWCSTVFPHLMLTVQRFSDLRHPMEPAMAPKVLVMQFAAILQLVDFPSLVYFLGAFRCFYRNINEYNL